MKLLNIVILATAAYAPFTQAASFNCAKAASQKEKLICADPALSRLDDDLGSAFARASTRVGANNLVRAWQRDWLRSRDVDDCADAACLRTLWSARIAQLDASNGSPWNGRYERFYNNKVDKNTAELTLVALAGGKVSVAGNAISIRSIGSDGSPNVNIGEVGDLARMEGNQLVLDADECHVEMTLKATRLVVTDNYQCGGNGVSFTGEYRAR
jgi:uncharacterized protein